MNSNELYHYGVKGMKWGVRRYRNKADDVVTKDKSKIKKMSTAKKVAIGAAATSAILASAYGAYTISAAYGRSKTKIIANAGRVAKSMSTASKFEQETLGLPKFDRSKYDEYFKEYMSKGMQDMFGSPYRKLLQPELKAQKRLMNDVRKSVAKRVSPPIFGESYPPESFRTIMRRYKEGSHV